MNNLFKIVLCGLLIGSYIYPMEPGLPPAADLEVASEPVALNTDSAMFDVELEVTALTQECLQHLQKDNKELVVAKHQELEQELERCTTVHKGQLLREQITAIKGLLEYGDGSDMHDAQCDTTSSYAGTTDQNLGQSIGATNSSISSQFTLVKELLVRDRLIGASFEYLKKGDMQYLQDKRQIAVHELSQCTNTVRKQVLAKQVQALDTMIAHPNAQNYSGIYHSESAASATPSHPSSAQQILDLGKRISHHNRQATHTTKRVTALPISKSWRGNLSIKVDGKKIYVTEGKHVLIGGVEWVAIGSHMFYIQPGQRAVDKNGVCHIRDLQGKLHSLTNNKWIPWSNGSIWIYQGESSRVIPEGESVLIDGVQLVNMHGALRNALPQNSSRVAPETVANSDMVSTPARAVPNISWDVDARIETTLKNLKQAEIAHAETYGKTSHFAEQMKAVGVVLDELKAKGLLKPNVDEVQEAIRHGIIHFLKEFDPTSIADNPREFMVNVTQHIAVATFHIMTDGMFIGAQEGFALATQIYDLYQAITTDHSDLSPNRRAELIAEQLAGIIKTFCADQITRRAFGSRARAGATGASNSSTSEVREVVVSDGTRVQVRDDGANTLLRDGTGASGSSIQKVENMKKFFEKFEFGKAIKKNSVKTKFVDIKTDSQIYEITQKLQKYGLKKGDQLYLDKFHGDHIEVFRNRKCISVLNLDGSLNHAKTNVAISQGRILKIKG